jgi:hypothetical protein
VSKGAWGAACCVLRRLPAARALREAQNRWIFRICGPKWSVFADFVVYRLVLASLKAKRARVWAPSVHQRAFWTIPGSENAFWARAAATKSRRTACLGEIACHGGAGIAVWGHRTAAGGRVATESGRGRPFPG